MRATDRAAAAASALEPIIINDRGRNGIDTRILQTIPQLFNTLNPQVLNMLHTAERFIISTAPTASQPPSSTPEAPARTDSHAINTCERVIENAVRYIPHSSCEQREEPSGDVICQVLDTCRGPRNYFAEADIVAICKIIYLKDELNKKIYFKLLHNLLLMDEQTCHTVLRCFLSIMHASILALTNNYVSTIKTDKFFSTLPRLCNSKKDDFPPAHLYGRLPYRHVSLDGRLDADARQHNSYFMGTVSEAVNMGCVDMGIGCSSYVSCERVLEQLRSMLIALPGAMQFFGMPIALSASDEGSSRSDSRSKRCKVSGLKSEKRSPHRHMYPIGFLFMATATKMFQSSPKLMNHLMMVIQHLVVSPETLNVHGALVAPVSLDDSSNASHVAGATPPENHDSVEMASGDEDGSAGRGDDTMNTSVDSSQASNSHRSQDDSILRVKQDILNKLDKDAVNLFLDIHTSWCHRSNWLLSCNTMRDGSSSAHLQLVARIMSALLLSEKHASNVREFFISRLNELIGVLCKSSLDMQAQRGEIIEADNENVILFEGVSISALEHRIAAMVRIVTFVNEMFTEVHKAETADSSVKSNRPAMLNEFYSNVNLDRLWRALDYTLTDLVRLGGSREFRHQGPALIAVAERP
ncbi:hypothetical protein, conserved [Babesia bigemina]|uniref:Uncharacterized protein n=1 Tax=Babesia bigemina TaxID=5866 RepID=A0A061BIL6_BABBI|nr:hypothetical protein, conserved [Babesia bigemina]CDR71362.1 hypothetical protein, conserved [Babesia bigemina]|eukprot:XP_012770312.1 hypothetical protein, conserved [Babesia bigemina]